MSSVLDEKLPHDWRLARFDEIMRRVDRKFTIDDSATYNCVGVRWYGKGTFVREQRLGLKIARKQQWRIKSGDVVYNKLFAWKGSFAIADDSVDGCIVSDKFPTYQVDPDEVDRRFLGFYFQTSELAQQAQRLSKGAAAISKLTLNPPQFWDLRMPLPPLTEQRRIVARIEELGGKVQKAQNLRREAVEKMDQLQGSYLYAAFNGPETKDWQKVKLATISRITSGGTPSRRNPLNFIGEIPWVKTLDLNCEVVRETEECISESALGEIGGKILPVGTVMIAMYGGAGTIGKSGILAIPAATNQAICSISPNPEVFVSEFLHYWLLLIRSKWMDYGVGTRVDPNINKGIVERMDFLLPSLAEQRRIVTYLDDLRARANDLRQLQAETDAKLDALLPSILDRAFKGELSCESL